MSEHMRRARFNTEMSSSALLVAFHSGDEMHKFINRLKAATKPDGFESIIQPRFVVCPDVVEPGKLVIVTSPEVARAILGIFQRRGAKEYEEGWAKL